MFASPGVLAGTAAGELVPSGITEGIFIVVSVAFSETIAVGVFSETAVVGEFSASIDGGLVEPIMTIDELSPGMIVGLPGVASASRDGGLVEPIMTIDVLSPGLIVGLPGVLLPANTDGGLGAPAAVGSTVFEAFSLVLGISVVVLSENNDGEPVAPGMVGRDVTEVLPLVGLDAVPFSNEAAGGFEAPGMVGSIVIDVLSTLELIVGLPAVSLPDIADGEFAPLRVVGGKVVDVLSLVIGLAGNVPFCPIPTALGPKVAFTPNEVGSCVAPGLVAFGAVVLGAAADSLLAPAIVGLAELVPFDALKILGATVTFPIGGIEVLFCCPNTDGVAVIVWLSVVGPLVVPLFPAGVREGLEAGLCVPFILVALEGWNV